jgi:lysophospholipid acyltransferase
MFPSPPQGYLTCLHLYRMVYHYGSWEMDATAPQMVLTIKLTSIAFNMLDGSKPDAELLPRQRQMAVRACPHPLDFFGYMFFFGSFLAGPACEYRDYEIFNDRSEFTHKHAPPSSVRAALGRLGAGFACGIGVVLYGMYNTDHLHTSWFEALPLYQRFLYLNLAISLSRYRYYLCWFIAEGSCTLAGLGYGGVDQVTGAARWDRLAQVDFFGVEFGQSFKQLTDSWNIRTGVWLKEYVYMRVPVALGDLPRIMATHLTSALWHGLYPGYFMFYVCMSFSIETGRRLRRALRWRFLGSPALKRAYDVAGWLAVLSTTNYFCGAFLLLDYTYIMRYWAATHFGYHYAVIAALALTFVVSSKPSPAKQAAALKEKGLKEKQGKHH